VLTDDERRIKPRTSLMHEGVILSEEVAPSAAKAEDGVRRVERDGVRVSGFMVIDRKGGGRSNYEAECTAYFHQGLL
jgi:hypothetical protein